MDLRSVVRKLSMPTFHAIDAVLLSVYDRKNLPPFELRLKAGTLRNVVGGGRWLAMGSQMLQEVIEFCGLTPESVVVEIGCACGIVALPMKAYLTKGRYIGIDIIPELIEWCDANLADDRFQFIDLGVANELYKPDALGDSTKMRLAVEDDSADVVFLVSVFTHMFPEEVAHYLAEIGRILKPGGKCLATMLTKDSYTPSLSRIKLEHHYSADCLCFDAQNRTRAVAFSRSLIEDMASKAGLSIIHVTPGQWDGRSKEKYFHDMYVFEKTSSSQVKKPEASLQ